MVVQFVVAVLLLLLAAARLMAVVAPSVEVAVEMVFLLDDYTD